MAYASDDETSSSSSEEANVDELDEDFLQAYAKIKQRDQSIYDPDAKLFREEASESSEQNESDSDKPHIQRKKDDPKFLRQVLAEQALAGGDDSDSDAPRSQRPLKYSEEQAGLKNAFLQAADEAEDELEEGDFGAVLKKRPAPQPGSAAAAAREDPVIKQLLVRCFDDKASQEDAFLREFVEKRQWRDGDEGEGGASAAVAAVDEPAELLEDDLQFTEQAERFEASFNFRFEEPGAAHAITYPRNVEGTVRKKDERRKEARERRTARKEAEAQASQQEAKRAKKAARAQHREQLAAFAAAAGEAAPDPASLEALMEADWDPDQYDQAMASAFGDDYYEAADTMEGDEQPEDAEDAADAEQLQAAVASAHDETTQQAAKDEGDDEDDDDVIAAAAAGRFRYKGVPKADYGLDVLDILGLDSKQLNQVVGLKRLAPYREDRGRNFPNMQKLRELREQQQGQPRQRTGKPQRDGKPKRPGKMDEGTSADISHPAEQPLQKEKPRKSKLHPKQRTGAAEAPEAKQLLADNAAPHTATTTEQPQQNGAQSSAQDEKRWAQRLQSYGKLTLQKEGGKKRKAEAIESPTSTATGLSKGEKKRLKRMQKRALKRQEHGS